MLANKVNMFIAVSASEDQKNEFLQKNIPPDIHVEFFENNSLINIPENIDAFFDFSPEYLIIKNLPAEIPVFKNAVALQLKDLPANYVRFNGWPGFIHRNIFEIVSPKIMEEKTKKIMDALQWKFIFVPDIQGMIAARIICMIINEAWYALDDEVSTKPEIDTAMKLGTNYPYGPFEWGEKIGLPQVAELLKKLSETDSRYLPSPLLLKSVKC